MARDLVSDGSPLRGPLRGQHDHRGIRGRPTASRGRIRARTRAQVGTIAEVRTAEQFDDGRWVLLAAGLSRASPGCRRRVRPYALVEASALPEVNGAGAERLVPQVQVALDRYLATVKRFVATAASESQPPEEMTDVTASLDAVLKPIRLPDDPLAASYAVGGLLQVELTRKQQLLELPDAASRLRAELHLLQREARLLGRRCPAADCSGRPSLQPELGPRGVSAAPRRSIGLACRSRSSSAACSTPSSPSGVRDRTQPAVNATPTATASETPPRRPPRAKRPRRRGASPSTPSCPATPWRRSQAIRAPASSSFRRGMRRRYPSLLAIPGRSWWDGSSSSPMIPASPRCRRRECCEPAVGRRLPRRKPRGCHAAARSIGPFRTRVPEVALTFDMGGRLDPALQIMNLLVANKVCATIFPTGAMSQTAHRAAGAGGDQAHPELFEVGNHTDAPLRPRSRGPGIADHHAVRQRSLAKRRLHSQGADRCRLDPQGRDGPGSHSRTGGHRTAATTRRC